MSRDDQELVAELVRAFSNDREAGADVLGLLALAGGVPMSELGPNTRRRMQALEHDPKRLEKEKSDKSAFAKLKQLVRAHTGRGSGERDKNALAKVLGLSRPA
jgi:hypothetical protein